MSKHEFYFYLAEGTEIGSELYDKIQVATPGAMRTKRLAYHALDFFVEARTRKNAVGKTLKKITDLGLNVVGMTIVVPDGKDETFLREGGKFVPGEEKALCRKPDPEPIESIDSSEMSDQESSSEED